VSRSWFYKWAHGDRSPRRARREALAAEIETIFTDRHGNDGSPRITAELHDRGWRVSQNTVAVIMAEHGWVARPKRRRRGTTRPDRSARKAPDLVGRGFAPPDRPDLVWVGDLTEIPNDEGRFYLATVEDLHSRRIVGFAMSDRHDTDVAKAALCMAIAVRGGSVPDVIMHTDQGGEYTGRIFAKACSDATITQSMGRTGSALDNACAESFNSTLEFELLRRSRFGTRAEARQAVADWIEDYNHQRRHSTNGMRSPVAHERASAAERAKRDRSAA
jgi:transposase InsO family protein